MDSDTSNILVPSVLCVAENRLQWHEIGVPEVDDTNVIAGHESETWIAKLEDGRIIQCTDLSETYEKGMEGIEQIYTRFLD